MNQRLGSARGAIDAIQIPPDLERPAGGENFRRADRAGVVEIHHFDMGMAASIAPYADFIVLHENPPTIHNSTGIPLLSKPDVQTNYNKCDLTNVDPRIAGSGRA